jgi:hypothetical protein
MPLHPIRTYRPWLICGLLLCCGVSAFAQDKALDCQECHNPEFSESIAMILESAHWDTSNPEAPSAKDDCRSCHGPSDKHRDRPTQVQPGTSFGPRWSDSIVQQNDICLACHADTTHANWADGKHASENLTCVTCHDLHAEDLVLTTAGQAQVCTVCHKVQKEGVHSFGDSEGQDPPCAQCHDPHVDPAPQVALLANRSEGCRACHDLAAMVSDPLVSDTAKSYHKIMVSADRTCIDCHRGVIHGAGHQAATTKPAGLVSDEVTLFFPGQVDVEWLATRHPGAQPLRQGSRQCRECHQGEGQSMGVSLGASPDAASRDVTISFASTQTQLNVTISWVGAGTRDISVMFSDDKDNQFAVGGCFAACHGDMAGMSRQRDQGHTKYLRSSRQQLRSIGRPALLHDDLTLATMRAEGRAVELWRARVVDAQLTGVESAESTEVESFTVLEARVEDAESKITARAGREAERSYVTFSRPLADAVTPIVAGQTYTFGFAVHDPGMTGAQHWVSLPLTFSLDGTNTDFVVAE